MDAWLSSPAFGTIYENGILAIPFFYALKKRNNLLILLNFMTMPRLDIEFLWLLDSTNNN